MTNALILHGIEKSKDEYDALPHSESNLGWYPDIQWEMTRRGILTQTPEMPKPFLPDMNYEEWAKTISNFDINPETILIGHSCGGGFWLKFLSLNPQIKIKQLILVAPWIDVDGEHPTFYSNWTLDQDLASRCERIDLFWSALDDDPIIKSINEIKSCLGDKILFHQIDKNMHFSWGTIGRNFPELLEIIQY